MHQKQHSSHTTEIEYFQNVHRHPFQERQLRYRNQHHEYQTFGCNIVCSIYLHHVQPDLKFLMFSYKDLNEAFLVERTRGRIQCSFFTTAKTNSMPHFPSNWNRFRLESCMATTRALRVFCGFEWHSEIRNNRNTSFNCSTTLTFISLRYKCS